jgi:hypothetical protein
MSQNLIEHDHRLGSTSVIEQELLKLKGSGKLHMMCYASVSFRQWQQSPWYWYMDDFRSSMDSEDRPSKKLIFLPKQTPGLKLIEKEIHSAERFELLPVETYEDGFLFRECQLKRLYKYCETTNYLFFHFRIDIYHGCSEWIETFVRNGVDIKHNLDPSALPQKLQFELSSLVGVPVLCFESIVIVESTNTVHGYMEGQHVALIPAYKFILGRWPLDLQQQTQAVKELQKIATDFTYPPNNWLI